MLCHCGINIFIPTAACVFCDYIVFLRSFFKIYSVVLRVYAVKGDIDAPLYKRFKPLKLCDFFVGKNKLPSEKHYEIVGVSAV